MNIDIIKNKQIREIIALVESESTEGFYYKVVFDGKWSCSCPQNSKRGAKCKHICAVEDKTYT